jgi:hypothetical protein
MKGKRFQRAGLVPNPFYRQKDQPFTHESFPIYLVTRLAGYDFDDVKGLIDRSLSARNRGKFVFDLKSDDDSPGNNWLRTAALALPKERVVMDESAKVLTGEKDVIGYAGWGSNDPNRHQRNLAFQWLPGALVTEYVSTNGRTFRRPPADWTIGTWKDVRAGSTARRKRSPPITSTKAPPAAPAMSTSRSWNSTRTPTCSFRPIPRPQSGRELLYCDARPELAEYRGGRSALQAAVSWGHFNWEPSWRTPPACRVGTLPTPASEARRRAGSGEPAQAWGPAALKGQSPPASYARLTRRATLA